MEERRYIDWEKTGKRVKLLRNDNISLRRYVCGKLNRAKGNCNGDCATCEYDMDSSISRPELAQVFYVSESVIFNWEAGKTPIPLEELIFYCDIANVSPEDVIVFKK